MFNASFILKIYRCDSTVVAIIRLCVSSFRMILAETTAQVRVTLTPEGTSAIKYSLVIMKLSLMEIICRESKNLTTLKTSCSMSLFVTLNSEGGNKKSSNSGIAPSYLSKMYRT